MGFPLRSNIFKAGTQEQKYFRKFPLQVAVLFSPTNREFSEGFRSIFLELDKLTADQVAFFAVLDPPEEWTRYAENRPWWREYRDSLGKVGFSVDKKALVREIARLFGVAWDMMPALVISTNLWLGEFVVTPTTGFHLLAQLQTLTDLAKSVGQPNVGQIIQVLREKFGFGVSYHPADSDLRYRFQNYYTFLDTIQGNALKENEYFINLDQQLRVVGNSLRQLRSGFDDHERQLHQDAFARESSREVSDASVDNVIENIAGRLVAPATVAERMFQRLQEEPSVFEFIDDATASMIETGLSIGNLLENVNRGDHPAFHRFRMRNSPSHPQDFTPGAQGFWKAFEREINLSVVQAFREVKAIKMPDFFALFEAGKDGLVSTGRGRTVNINQEDWEFRELFKVSGRQRFITLGDAWHVRRVMSGDPALPFEMMMCRILGHAFPHKLIDDWETIFQIRNSGSHSNPLSQHQYNEVVEKCLDPDNLRSLSKIKLYLSQRH